jgi:hypothetical protein
MPVTRSRRWLLVVVAASACAALGTAAAGFLGVGPLSGLAVTETRLQPQLVALLKAPGDPDVVLVGVTWTEEGYCLGQFDVRATETPTEVRIGPVTSREDPRVACAGIGTADNLAWVEVRLAAPLGGRAVVRGSDGSALPVSYR